MLALIFIFIIVIVNFLAINTLENNSNTNLNTPRNFLIFNVFYCSVMIIPLILDRLFGFGIFRIINQIFRVSFISPIFADLETILNGINCENVKQVGDLINCPSKTQNIWNYPTALLNLRNLINPELRFIIGLSFVILFLALINFLFYKNFWQINLYTAIILISPPFLLVINRGNLDLLIVVLLILGCLLLDKKPWHKFVSFLIFSFTVWLKFYTLPVFLIIFISTHSRRIKFLSIFIGFLVFCSVRIDLLNLSHLLSKDTSGAVGLSVLIAKSSGSTDSTFLANPATAIVLTLTFLLLTWSMNKEIKNIDLKPYYNPLFFIPGFIFLTTWLTTSNYYYRLVLISLVLIYMLKNSISLIEYKIIFFAFCGNYLSLQTFGLIQNLCILPIIFFIVMIIYRLTKESFWRSHAKI